MCADSDQYFSTNVASIISSLKCVYGYCESTGSQQRCQEVLTLLHCQLSAFHMLSAGIAYHASINGVREQNEQCSLTHNWNSIIFNQDDPECANFCDAPNSSDVVYFDNIPPIYRMTSTISNPVPYIPPNHIYYSPSAPAIYTTSTLNSNSMADPNKSSCTFSSSNASSNNSSSDIVPTKLPTNNEKADVVPTKLSTNNEKADTVPTKLPTNHEKADTVPTKLPTNNEKADTVPTKLSTNNEKADTVPTKLPTNNEKADVVPPKLPTNNEKADTVPTKLPTNNEKADVVPTKLPTNNEKADTVLTKLPTNNDKADTVPIELSTNNERADVVPAEFPTNNENVDIVPTKFPTNNQRVGYDESKARQDQSSPVECSLSDDGEWKVVMSRSKLKAMSKRRGSVRGREAANLRSSPPTETSCPMNRVNTTSSQSPIRGRRVSDQVEVVQSHQLAEVSPVLQSPSRSTSSEVSTAGECINVSAYRDSTVQYTSSSSRGNTPQSTGMVLSGDSPRGMRAGVDPTVQNVTMCKQVCGVLPGSVEVNDLPVIEVKGGYTASISAGVNNMSDSTGVFGTSLTEAGVLIVPDSTGVFGTSLTEAGVLIVCDSAKLNDLPVTDVEDSTISASALLNGLTDSAEVSDLSVYGSASSHVSGAVEVPGYSRAGREEKFVLEGRKRQLGEENFPVDTETGRGELSRDSTAAFSHQSSGGKSGDGRSEGRGEESDDSEECMMKTEIAISSAIAERRCLEEQLIETTRLQPKSGDYCVSDDGVHLPDRISDMTVIGVSRFDHTAVSSTSSSPPADSVACIQLNTDEEITASLSSRNRPPDKLLSPRRVQQPSETIRRHKERQQKAQLLRNAFIEQKTQKLSDISRKIEVVRQQQEVLVEQRRALLERKMARAEQRRQRHLRGIVRRAHDEEEKAREIAFINEIEAQNKRHDFLESVQSQEARLVELQEERQRRMQEKAAVAEAVARKRQQLQQQRHDQLERMKQRRLSKLERIDRELRDKEKERQELAREKERDRHERRSALEAAHQATVEQLDQRIRQKQLASARRHEENMHGIRRRALELSVRCAASGESESQLGQTAVYQTKKVCTLCDVLIGSEMTLLSHLRGEQHRLSLRGKYGSAELGSEQLMAINLEHIGDARARHVYDVTFSGRRQRRLYRLRRKISTRCINRSVEYTCSCEVGNHRSCFTAQLVSLSADSTGFALPAHHQTPAEPVNGAGLRSSLLRAVRGISSLQRKQGQRRWSDDAVLALLRHLKQVQGCLQQQQQKQRYWCQLLFCSLGGAEVLSALLQEVGGQLVDGVEILPTKAVVAIANLLASVCDKNARVSVFFCATNLVRSPLDLLTLRLALLNCTGTVDCDSVEWDPGTSSLLHLVSVILLSLHQQQLPTTQQKMLHDVCSYAVCIGLIDWVSSYFSWTNADLQSESHLSDFLLQGLRFLRALSTVCSERGQAAARDLLVDTLRVTQLSHIVQLLYTLLLPHCSSHRHLQQQQQHLQLSEQARNITLEAFHTLHQVSALDIEMFQSCCGEEGRSLEFRHVTSLLLGYCHQHQFDALMRLLVPTVGCFAVGSVVNQACLLTGRTPTVVQQLLSLPLTYFIDQHWRALLFPTLLACCYGNQQAVALLEQEMSYQALEEFLFDKKNAHNALIARILNRMERKQQMS